MLVKTLRRLSDAQDIERSRVAAAGDSIRAAAMTHDDSVRVNNPDSLRFAIDGVAGVRQVRGLIDSRKEQREDWIAYTIAVTLASGIDAFVTAHLSQLPATVSATPRRGGGANLNIRMPVGRRP